MSDPRALTSNATRLTQANLLVRNMIINLLGFAAPLLVALFSIPLLIKYLGTERFGILTLAWVVISYLSMLDLGLGRALTKLISEKIGTGEEFEIPSIIWSGLSLVLSMGVMVAILAGFASPFIVRKIMQIPEYLIAETVPTFILLSCSVPIVVASVSLRGVLEAHQRFDIVNAVRIPIGVYTFLAPLIILPFSRSIFHVVILLVVGRFIGCTIQLFYCLKIVKSLKDRVRIQRTNIIELIRFGSWMTVTNIIAPLLFYFDRFFISALISVTAVTYYATPSEIVTKLLIVTGALLGVLFPALTTSFYVDIERSKQLPRTRPKTYFRNYLSTGAKYYHVCS